LIHHIRECSVSVSVFQSWGFVTPLWTATKQLVHTLVRTGAFEEIARAIPETTIAIRDIANEVNETVKDLKERGSIKDIAGAVVETTNSTRNTIGIAKAAIETDNTKETF
jgi:DNA-binding transcriptional regulator GbsR (MarR family)